MLILEDSDSFCYLDIENLSTDLNAALNRHLGVCLNVTLQTLRFKAYQPNLDFPNLQNTAAKALAVIVPSYFAFMTIGFLIIRFRSLRF